MNSGRPGARRGRAVAGAAVLLFGVSAALLAVALRGGADERVLTRAGGPDAPAIYQGGERTFVTSDSVKIAARQLVLRSRGAVILVHGLGEPDSLFARWNEVLSQTTQMSVIGFALRGNGRSRGTDARDDPAAAFLLDVAAIVKELKRRNPSGPLLALASYGGVGIMARYEAERRTRHLPAFDGIILLDGEFGSRARVPNSRPMVVQSRRLRTLDALGGVLPPGVSPFDRLEVARQSGTGIELASRWTFGQWRAASPEVAPLLAAQWRTATPMLVVSRRPPPDSLPPQLTWVTARGAVDPNTPDVSRAIARWSSDYAEDAFEPIPPRPTQTLDILRKP